MSTRQKIILNSSLIFILLLVVFIIILTAYKVCKVTEVKGSVSDPTEIPLIGDRLERFPSSGKIEYVIRTGWRNRTVFWAGKMEDPYKTGFFDNKNWKSWNEAESNMKGIGRYEVQSSPDNVLFYKSEADVNGFSISVYFMPSNDTFIAQAISISH